MRIKQLEEKTESRTTKKIWYVDGHEFTTSRSAAEYIMMGCPADYYDEYLDTQYGDIEICGHIFTASESFHQVSRMAYNMGFRDWKEYETENLIEELEEMLNGEAGEWFDLPVICEMEENENA